MRRRFPFLFLAATLVVLSGCAAGSDAAGPDRESTSNTTVATTMPGTTAVTLPPTAEPAGPPTTTTTVRDDRPVAPDFSLDLGNGGTFVLAEESRPVFMVFWAEW